MKDQAEHPNHWKDKIEELLLTLLEHFILLARGLHCYTTIFSSNHYPPVKGGDGIERKKSIFSPFSS